MPASWQVAQPLVIPAWFITVPAKLVVDLWQVAQSAVVGMWPVPCGFGVTPVKAVPVALAAWHVVQPLVMPLWFITPGTRLFGLVWHSVQAWFVGMWLAGLPPVTPLLKEGVEVWQVPHSPLLGWFGSCAAVGRVTIVTPKKLLPVSWHVAQAVPLTAAWFIAVPENVVKLLAAWQLSQAAVVGM